MPGCWWQLWSAGWRRWWPWSGGCNGGAGNEGRGAFAGLGLIWLAAAATSSATFWVARGAGPIELGGVSWQSATVFAGTLAYPALVTLGVLGTLWGYRHAPRRWYAAWSGLVAVAHVAITAYLGWSGWLAFRSWLY